MQILSVCTLAALAAWVYLPTFQLSLPSTAKPPLLKQVEQVVAIRDSYKQEQVTAACNTLLAVLLQVPQ